MDKRRCFGSVGAQALLAVVVLVLPRGGSAREAASEKTVPPPRDVVLNGTQLTWNSAADDVTFTVEYEYNSGNWTSIKGCSNTSLASCGVGGVPEKTEYGCMQLRVSAQRNGENSEWVEACSREDFLCTPNITLTAGPGSLTVNVKKNERLDWRFGDLLENKIYLWKKGETEEFYKDSTSSKFIQGLEVGQQYCVKVEFLVYWVKRLGPPSCVQCVTIPDFSQSKQTQIITISIMVAVIFGLVVLAYVKLFKSKKIKQLLQPPYTIPALFQEVPVVDKHAILAESPTEEPYDVVSNLTPRQPKGD